MWRRKPRRKTPSVLLQMWQLLCGVLYISCTSAIVEPAIRSERFVVFRCLEGWPHECIYLCLPRYAPQTTQKTDSPLDYSRCPITRVTSRLTSRTIRPVQADRTATCTTETSVSSRGRALRGCWSGWQTPMKKSDRYIPIVTFRV